MASSLQLHALNLIAGHPEAF